MFDESFLGQPALLWALTGASLVVSLIGIRSVIGILTRRAIIAHPNERSMHVAPVPTGGGVIIIALAVAALVGLPGISSIPFNGVLVGGILLLAVISWFDDTRGLTPRTRIIVHLAVVMLALFYAIDDGQPVLSSELPFWLDRILTGFCWLWFINLFNFMDGIDGLAGSETVAITTGIVVLSAFVPLSDEVPCVALILFGATLGFLWWNWKPARIYMGDTGAVPLGFLLGWMLIRIAQQGYLLAALILPLCFVADATITLVRRLLNGEKIWQAHRSHFYQRAALKLKDHAAVVLRFAAANALLILAALISLTRPLSGLMAAFLVTAGLLWHLRRIATRPDRKEG